MKTLDKKYIKKTTRKTYSTKVKVIANELIQRLADQCDMGRSQNSCGIRDLDEVNEEFENNLLEDNDFNDDFNSENKEDKKEPKLNPTEYAKYKEYLIDNFSTLLKKRLNYNSRRPWAFYNISLNHHANKDLIEILDKSTPYQTDWRINPNSSNKIKVWLI